MGDIHARCLSRVHDAISFFGAALVRMQAGLNSNFKRQRR